MPPSRSLVDLFDSYDGSWEEGARTSAPFLQAREGKLSLHFNKSGVQSLMDEASPTRLMLGYTRTMMSFLRFNKQPEHIGMIGLGGGSLAKYCYQHLPESRVTVCEISPEVIALRERFRIPKDNRRFQVFCENGAEFVQRQREEFDVLLIDGFDSGGQPAELCSSEFYEHCYGALRPGGILVVNICDSGRSMLIPRLNRIFRNSVTVLDGEESTNTIAFAGKAPRNLEPKNRCKTLSIASKPTSSTLSLTRPALR